MGMEAEGVPARCRLAVREVRRHPRPDGARRSGGDLPPLPAGLPADTRWPPRSSTDRSRWSGMRRRTGLPSEGGAVAAARPGGGRGRMTTATSRARRQQRIVDLGGERRPPRNPIFELLARGIRGHAGDAFSRDLIELGAEKVRVGKNLAYAVPAEGGDRTPRPAPDATEIGRRLQSAVRNCSSRRRIQWPIVVLRTPPGAASFLCPSAIDHSQLPGVLGASPATTPSCFITSGKKASRETVRRLLALAGITDVSTDSAAPGAIRLQWGGRFAGGPSDALAALSKSTHFDWRLAAHDIIAARVRAHRCSPAPVCSTTRPRRDARRARPARRRCRPAAYHARRRRRGRPHGARARIDRARGRRVGGRLRRALLQRPDRDAVQDVSARARPCRRLVLDLVDAVVGQADAHFGVAMPGRTHLQHAQPVLLSHLLAHAWPLLRDVGRLRDWDARTVVAPWFRGPRGLLPRPRPEGRSPPTSGSPVLWRTRSTGRPRGTSPLRSSPSSAR